MKELYCITCNDVVGKIKKGSLLKKNTKCLCESCFNTMSNKLYDMFFDKHQSKKDDIYDVDYLKDMLNIPK